MESQKEKKEYSFALRLTAKQKDKLDMLSETLHLSRGRILRMLLTSGVAFRTLNFEKKWELLNKELKTK